jgi:hypothetical protein
VDSTPTSLAPPRPPARRRPGPRGPGRAELRADLRGSLLLAALLGLVGLPAGLLWAGLAPRAQFDVVPDGAVVVGRPSAELLFAVDGVYTLVLAGLGLLAGLVAWRLRARRGVGTLLGLALGMSLAALGAWQVGELAGPGPTEAELAEVGARLTTGVSLGSPAALTIGPFVGVLVYVVVTLLAAADDLGRPGPPPTPAAAPVTGAEARAPAGGGQDEVLPRGANGSVQGTTASSRAVGRTGSFPGSALS